jgi:hypothetical protein
MLFYRVSQKVCLFAGPNAYVSIHLPFSSTYSASYEESEGQSFWDTLYVSQCTGKDDYEIHMKIALFTQD